MEKTSPYVRFGCMMLMLLLCINVRAQITDIRWLRQINLHRNAALDNDMQFLTNSVYPLSAALPLAELATGYARHDKKVIAAGWSTTAALACNFVFTFGLKYSVDRTRPYITYPDIQHYKSNKDASFPSGHTSFAFNTATSLVQLYPRWYVIVPAYAWAGAVAYSRMHLGMHYPTDVLAGAVIGAGTSLLAVKGEQWIRHHKKKKIGA